MSCQLMEQQQQQQHSTGVTSVVQLRVQCVCVWSHSAGTSASWTASERRLANALLSVDNLIVGRVASDRLMTDRPTESQMLRSHESHTHNTLRHCSVNLSHTYAAVFDIVKNSLALTVRRIWANRGLLVWCNRTRVKERKKAWYRYSTVRVLSFSLSRSHTVINAGDSRFCCFYTRAKEKQKITNSAVIIA